MRKKEGIIITVTFPGSVFCLAEKDWKTALSANRVKAVITGRMMNWIQDLTVTS